MAIALLYQRQISNVDFNFLIKKLKKTFSSKVSLQALDGLPLSSFNERRGQYYSTGVLNYLIEKLANYQRALTILDIDLYVPYLSFVFGEADLVNKKAVVSISRLKPKYSQGQSNAKLLTDRLVKEAVHELGHTYKLNHCREEKCVMSFSSNLVKVDNKSSDFCFDCKRLILEL